MSSTRRDDSSPTTSRGRRVSVSESTSAEPAEPISAVGDHLTIPLTADRAVQCPQCGSSAGLHFDEVSLIDPAGDIVPLHAEGGDSLSVVAAVVGSRSLPARRHMIVLPHWCGECGSQGELVLRQQSGQTYGEYREVKTSALIPEARVVDEP